jgi:hypothetical protein
VERKLPPGWDRRRREGDRFRDSNAGDGRSASVVHPSICLLSAHRVDIQKKERRESQEHIGRTSPPRKATAQAHSRSNLKVPKGSRNKSGLAGVGGGDTAIQRGKI